MDKINTLFTKKQITERIDELAKELNELYKDENELTAICVLKGSSIFFTDLVRKLTIPVRFEFLKLSSYGNDTKSSHKFYDISLNTSDLTGKNVLLVEDIVDSGHTLNFVNKFLNEKYNMKSYRTITLLNKPCARDAANNINPDFYGFEIDNKFVVGYGLDKAEMYRNLDYIGYIS